MLLSVNIWGPSTQQCDQMGRLFFQYLAIYSNETHSAQWQFLAQAGSKYFQIMNTPFEKLPKTFRFFPKCRNFAKSGHTAFPLFIFFAHQQCDQIGRFNGHGATF